MCNIDRIEQRSGSARTISGDPDPRILSMGLEIIGKLIEGELSQQPSSDDVLGAATTAYQQGKITKAQYFDVINALDESTTVRTTASVETPGQQWNREYLAANKFLNQFRG